eukprot:gnl/TRDRNA2_/TRDRNA2_83138_c0_seq1.p1 gnl/TRDRNA2_/TRDRNA2_83138_c0~~gnl/TRDRNA2_/TRDRNA2_83138_c0_seq1.p1  ORF type:complete len:765 (-),score=138.88 gnl/TRDRNA2_/TRDRNA2_83138_c0_seq1:222-2516(-)
MSSNDVADVADSATALHEARTALLGIAVAWVGFRCARWLTRPVKAPQSAGQEIPKVAADKLAASMKQASPTSLGAVFAARRSKSKALMDELHAFAKIVRLMALQAFDLPTLCFASRVSQAPEAEWIEVDEQQKASARATKKPMDAATSRKTRARVEKAPRKKADTSKKAEVASNGKQELLLFACTVDTSPAHVDSSGMPCRRGKAVHIRAATCKDRSKASEEASSVVVATQRTEDNSSVMASAQDASLPCTELDNPNSDELGCILAGKSVERSDSEEESTKASEEAASVESVVVAPQQEEDSCTVMASKRSDSEEELKKSTEIDMQQKSVESDGSGVERKLQEAFEQRRETAAEKEELNLSEAKELRYLNAAECERRKDSGVQMGALGAQVPREICPWNEQNGIWEHCGHFMECNDTSGVGHQHQPQAWVMTDSVQSFSEVPRWLMPQVEQAESWDSFDWGLPQDMDDGLAYYLDMFAEESYTEGFADACAEEYFWDWSSLPHDQDQMLVDCIGPWVPEHLEAGVDWQCCDTSAATGANRFQAREGNDEGLPSRIIQSDKEGIFVGLKVKKVGGQSQQEVVGLQVIAEMGAWAVLTPVTKLGAWPLFWNRVTDERTWRVPEIIEATGVADSLLRFALYPPVPMSALYPVRPDDSKPDNERQEQAVLPPQRTRLCPPPPGFGGANRTSHAGDDRPAEEPVSHASAPQRLLKLRAAHAARARRARGMAARGARAPSAARLVPPPPKLSSEEAFPALAASNKASAKS